MTRTMLVLLGAIATAVPLYAHHSFSAVYFEGQSVTIEGELVRFELKNPHSWVYVMAKDEKGQLQQFEAEWANAGRLKQAGMTPETLRAGDVVVITGSPGRKPEQHQIHLKKIVRPADGWTWGGGGGPGGPGGRGGDDGRGAARR